LSLDLRNFKVFEASVEVEIRGIKRVVTLRGKPSILNPRLETPVGEFRLLTAEKHGDYFGY